MKVIRLIIMGKTFTDKYRDDHVSAFAAQAAFFIILSFFPFTMFLLTLTQFLPFTQSDIMDVILTVVPAESKSIVVAIVTDLFSKTSTTLLSFSIITALWSASRGILSITRGLNAIYGKNETRNYFILRFLSMLYTLIFSIVLVLVLTLLVFGNSLYRYIAKIAPLLKNVADIVLDFRMLGVITILVCFFTIMYRFIPNRNGALRHELPGALFAAACWSLLSFAFSIYVDHFSNFSYMYGSLTGIVIIMLWLYVCMTVFFIGAELNNALFPSKPDYR